MAKEKSRRSAVNVWLVGGGVVAALLVASVVFKLFMLMPAPNGAKSGCLEAKPGHPSDRTVFVNSIGMEFVLIPSGEFLMGNPRFGAFEYQPVHEVRITRPFWLAKCEVTQAQWKAIMGSNPSIHSGWRMNWTNTANHPVENVSWDQVHEFIRKLNRREKEQGYRYRLPTEAEWEYAARAGSAPIYIGDSAAWMVEYAWYSANSGTQTHPVGQLKPNAWGLHDMHGNVSEWVQDYWGWYSEGAVTDPQGPEGGESRVIRGGSYRGTPETLEWRFPVGQGGRLRFVGFRLLRTEP